MRNILLIDGDKCTGCSMCVLACSFGKTDTFNPARSRIRLVNWEEQGKIVPVVCQQCEEPVCMACCPVDAISRNEETGLIEINRQVCINCKICREVCPFGGPLLDPVSGDVVLCDLCGGNPACVEVCPTSALQYVRADRDNAKRRLAVMGKIRESIVALNKSLK